MTVLAILQARMSSTRLPGKVLAPVLGEPMILRQLERLQRTTTLDRIVVATSTDPSDDVLTQRLDAEGVEVRRGPLADVAARFGAVVDEVRPDTMVRLTADCPLADPEVIDRVVSRHVESGSDYTSNTLERTYPQGLDVECVSGTAFARMLALPLTETEREHVTLGIYNRPDEFTLASITQDRDLSNLRWTVDLPADLAFVREVYGALYRERPKFGQDDILRLIDERPGLRHTN